MKYPKESLDDFVVPALEPTEPPRAVSLRLTGEVEVLKPLARWEGPAKTAPVADGAGRRSWFDSSLADRAPASLSWFHRSLALGGTVAMVALVLTSAIVIGMYDRPADEGREIVQIGDANDPAQDARPDRRQLPPKVPPMSDKFTAADTVPTIAGPGRVFEFGNTRYVTRVRTVSHSVRRPHVRVAAYRPRRRSPQPQLVASQFFPTTLVIYIENGLIKSRIERWLNAGN